MSGLNGRSRLGAHGSGWSSRSRGWILAKEDGGMGKRVSELVRVLVERDGLSVDEAQELVEEARELVRDGEDPEEVLAQEFGLEPDYVFDLLEGV